jgi:hypothetical protein
VKADPALQMVKAFQNKQQQQHRNIERQLPTQSMIDLLLTKQQQQQEKQEKTSSSTISTFTRNEAERFSFSQLRDYLITLDPLNAKYIQEVNHAEAQFWEASTDSRQDDSRNILGFDCGGEQYVFEVCFPIGSISENRDNTTSSSYTGKDIEFVKKLLKIIEEKQIVAACPIEQRWTARSTAPMSPAYSQHEDEVFSWVGIIMYIPSQLNSHQKQEIQQAFQEYVAALQPLLDEYQAQVHWAKLELPRKASPLSSPPVVSSWNSWWSYLGYKDADNGAISSKIDEIKFALSSATLL